MEQELISKKELLELTGISYGQLYRWKRKNLIPEDWFIRKSTFTGQETFFVKQKILERINKIKNLKDDLSLDELADVFVASNGTSGMSAFESRIVLSKVELVERNIVSKVTMDFISRQFGDVPAFSFFDMLCAFLLEKLLRAGELNLDEGKLLIQTLREHYKSFEGKPCEIIFIRKMGVPSFILVSSPTDIYFDNGVKVVVRITLASVAEQLKRKIGGMEGHYAE